MASCENCHTSGIKAENMRVVEEFDGGPKFLIGPCCVGAPIQFGRPEMVYHLEFSSTNGLVARVEYGDLKVEYKKTQEQLRRTFSPGAEPQPDVH